MDVYTYVCININICVAKVRSAGTGTVPRARYVRTIESIRYEDIDCDVFISLCVYIQLNIQKCRQTEESVQAQCLALGTWEQGGSGVIRDEVRL